MYGIALWPTVAETPCLDHSWLLVRYISTYDVAGCVADAAGAALI